MSGAINLPYYQDSNRTPGFFADIDGSRANTTLFQQRTLVPGYKQPIGAAVTNTPILFTTLGRLALLVGDSSMLYAMVKAYIAQDPFAELWILPLAEPTGTKASGSVAINGTATASGLLSTYFGGLLVSCPVYAGDTGTVIAARLVSLMALNTDLAVTYAAAGNTITLTAVHPGLLGNDIDLRSNFRGAPGGEAPVPGITQAFTPMTMGTGVPSQLAMALASLGETTFDFIACPFTDTASLDAMDAFLAETATGGRWSWLQMLFGGYFTASRGSVGTLAAFGTSRNGKFGSPLMVLPDEPDPIWLHVADYTANMASSLRNDPNLPLQYIVLGTKAPPVGSRVTRALRNTLLYDGISTKSVNDAGQNVMERAITSYQTNIAGAPDNAFLDVETIYGLAFLIRRWQDRMATLFARKKLALDGGSIPAGSNIVTDNIIRSVTIAWYRSECEAGTAQDPDGFAKAVRATNAGNGLVKELLPVILLNQLRQIAAVAQFTKP